MKAQLTAALELLNGMAYDVRPGGRSEIDFKQALVEIQRAIDEPEPAPKTVTESVVVTSEIAEQVGAQMQSMFAGLASRLVSIENATIGLLTDVTNASGKIDGITNTLSVIVTNTTPAPAAA
jgi:hypothetical protein